MSRCKEVCRLARLCWKPEQYTGYTMLCLLRPVASGKLQDKIKKLHGPPRTPLHKSQTNYKAWYSHFPVFWDENFWNGWNNLIHTSARCLCSAQGRGTALKGSSRLSGGTGRTWCAIACLLKPQPKDGTRGTQGSARRGTPHEKWADVWHKS